MIVFDHHNNMLKIVSLAPPSSPEGDTNVQQQSNEAPSGAVGGALDSILKAMNKANVQVYGFRPVGDVVSTLTDEQHKANIRRGI